MSKALRVACYMRVSTSGQTEKWGLPAQRTALESECVRNGWTAPEWFEDRGISGETIDERPAFCRLLDALRAGRVDLVLAVEWERFSRSQHARDWATILAVVEEAGARLAIPGQVLDPASPEDSFLGGLFGLLAAREKAKFLGRTARGARERVKSGRYWGSTRPFGYRVGDDGKLVPDPTEAEVVRRVFREIREGRTLCDVAEGLNTDAVPTHKGGREWHPSAVRRVLLNPVHAGVLVYGRHVAKPRGGARFRVDGAHEANIPPHEWEAVQALVETRKRAGCPPSRWSSGYFLTGVLRCPTCDGRMYGGSSGATRGPSVRYYGHMRSRMPGAPKCRKVRADDVEAAVLRELSAALGSPTVLEAVRRELVQERMLEGTEESRQRAALDDELTALDRRAAALYEDRVQGVLTPAQFKEWNEKMIARQAEIRTEVRRLEDRMLSLGRHADIEGLVTLLRDMPRALSTLEPRELKRLVWEVVREVRLGSTGSNPPHMRIGFRLPLIERGSDAKRCAAV
jgi:site-specific DNA recombinase